MTKDWWRIVLVVGSLSAGTGFSMVSGIPAEMPGGSLGWPALLHLERSVALLGLAAAAVFVGVQATQGRFPTKLGHLEYPTDDIDRRDSAVIKVHDERLLLIEEILQIVPRATESVDKSRYDR